MGVGHSLMPKPKTILILSDRHGGHFAGITPPEWHVSRARRKLRALQEELWDWFVCELATIGPVDVVIDNGDAIDGLGKKSGGTELITLDRNDQVVIAERVVDLIKPRLYVQIYGTPYHTGDAEDWEALLAARIAGKDYCRHVQAGGHEFIDVEGVVFDCKHKIGGSQIPHGRYTSLARDVLWNQLWAEADRQPRAQVVLRGHVHYFRYLGDGERIAMTLPALQAAHTKFGARQCSGTVDFGFVVFRCSEGRFTWDARILRPKAEAARLLRTETFLGERSSPRSKRKTVALRGGRPSRKSSKKAAYLGVA